MSGRNPLQDTPLSHHEAGNEYCRYCERMEVLYPVLCSCGGLVHRDGESAESSAESVLEICDQCGKQSAN